MQGKPKKKVVSLRNIEKLYTPIPAGQLLNPVHAGYAEVLALGSWERYWCVVHSGALYLYQTHESPATSLTIVLKGLLTLTLLQTLHTMFHAIKGCIESVLFCVTFISLLFSGFQCIMTMNVKSSILFIGMRCACG